MAYRKRTSLRKKRAHGVSGSQEAGGWMGRSIEESSSRCWMLSAAFISRWLTDRCERSVRGGGWRGD